MFVFFFHLIVCRQSFQNTFLLSTAAFPGKSITYIFCTLSPEQLPMALSVCVRNGIKWELFLWEKPNLKGAPHQGGARQATCCEYILIAFRRGENHNTSHNSFYSLIDLNTRGNIEVSFSLLILFCPLLDFVLFFNYRTRQQFEKRRT